MPKQLTVSEEPAPKDEAEKPKKQKKKNRKGKAGDGGADDTANTREEPINESEIGSDQPRP